MKQLEWILADIGAFSCELLGQYALREYQLEAARKLVDLVEAGEGGKAAVVFSRQSGKDEMLAQLIAFLLLRNRNKGGNIVVALPTVQQADISRNRLLERLNTCGVLRQGVRNTGYIVRCGKATARFLSAAPSANVRGETADILLVANEAQDIQPDIWDARFDPMGASTNAPTLFMGTPWASSSLLAREMKVARRNKRLYVVDWQRVAQDLPAYGERVRQRMAQFGVHHPFIRTEYECRELNADGGLFPPSRRALMQGTHARLDKAETLSRNAYALLVDVAGADETSEKAAELTEEVMLNGRRDSTAITVVQVEAGEGLPVYRVVSRYLWQNVPLQEQSARIIGLVKETWQARLVVVDSTGIGAGLASALISGLGRNKVKPFTFTLKSKSDLGWNWLGLIESGRYFEYAPDGLEDTRLFWRQLAAVEFEVMSGPGRMLRWSVRNPNLHDDLVMSAGLVATLDEYPWQPRRARNVA